MHPMAIDRRTVLQVLAGLACGPSLSARAEVSDGQLLAATRQGADGTYSAAIFHPDGSELRAVALPERGHDIAVCPRTRRCVVFARRPGDFAVAFSRDSAADPIVFTTPADRHFYGHGVFSPDGRLLYATENDFAGARGVVGVYDVQAGYARIGEFSSHGVGPHELVLLRDTPVMVIANGGHVEHPDFGEGRRILNPDAIETSIAYVDLRTGDLLERHVLGPSSLISLRHLDVGAGDTVVIGAQHQKPSAGPARMVFRHRQQESLTPCLLPDDVEAALKGYVSSVAVDSSGTVAAVSSAPGGRVTMLEIATGRVLRSVSIADVSGIAPAGHARAFMATNGFGAVLEASIEHSEPLQQATTPWQWDNHAVAIRRNLG